MIMSKEFPYTWVINYKYVTQQAIFRIVSKEFPYTGVIN
jgi:hypothetical protein